jgi:GNAT superfamily N-acetyltransferase
MKRRSQQREIVRLGDVQRRPQHLHAALLEHREVGEAGQSGLFVLPTRWDEGIGSVLLQAAVGEMRSRGYQSAQLFTATANQRSRIFYERRDWRAGDVDTHEHDNLRLGGYERSLER